LRFSPYSLSLLLLSPAAFVLKHEITPPMFRPILIFGSE
jgi:hypothetical protein